MIGTRKLGALRRGLAGLTLATVLVIGASGCGGGGSASTAAQAEVERARHEGEDVAREQDRIKGLQRRVKRLEHRAAAGAGQSAGPVSAEPSPAAQARPGSELRVLRTFHTPSGNVSCEVLADGALCSVASTGETFSLRGLEPGRIEPGAAVAAGSGELVPYGSTLSEGAVSCSVPPSSVPRGVTCENAETGHGFEASRVAARQRAY